MLVRNADRLVTQRQLLQEVWGPGYLNEANYLRVYVANLRRKLEPSPSRPRYLLTEPGMGYRFLPGAQCTLSAGGRLQLVGRVEDRRARP